MNFVKVRLSLMTHLAWSYSQATCAHNQVFVYTFSTVDAFDNGNYSLMQLVCGGLFDPTISPA